jgi:type I restriction enzyme S subunit
MKQGWEIRKLGEVCDFQNGFAFKSNTYKEKGLPILRITNIQNQSLEINELVYFDTKDYKENFERFKVFKDDLVVAMSGATTGKLGINTTDTVFYLNQRVGKFIPKKEIIKPFLYYFLSTKVEESLRIAAGAAQPNLSTEQINNFEIPVPPLSEQRRIVSILAEAFTAIAKAKANAEQNLKNAKELFESYIENLFLKIYLTSEKKAITELAKVIGGYSFKSGDFKKEGKYQVIRMGNVRHGIIRENESPVFIDSIDEKALTKALLLPNDVIITQTGTKNKRDYGFTVIIENKNYLLNQRIASIRFANNYLPKFFLYFSWTNIFRDQYFENETGTVGQGNVGIGAITESQVPFISVKEQKLIVDRIDDLKIESQKLEAIYQQKINDLEELKKSILQKAFSGELNLEEKHFKQAI